MRCPSTGLKSATQPHVSIDATWMRGMCIFSRTTTSASRKTRSVASLSPSSQCQIRLSVWPSLSVRSTGASGSSALNGSTTGVIGSYSTSTAATPSAAAYRLVAITPATSWDWYMTVSVGSTIWVSDIRVGIQCRLYASRSLPVRTASTPGVSSALAVSIFLIFPWATGLRTMSSQSIPGRTWSSM